MWLSELVGRLQQRLHENGDMRVKTKVKGIHFSDFDKNYVDVESHSFVVVHIKERNEKGQVIKDRKQMEVML